VPPARRGGCIWPPHASLARVAAAPRPGGHGARRPRRALRGPRWAPLGGDLDRHRPRGARRRRAGAGAARPGRRGGLAGLHAPVLGGGRVGAHLAARAGAARGALGVASGRACGRPGLRLRPRARARDAGAGRAGQPRPGAAHRADRPRARLRARRAAAGPRLAALGERWLRGRRCRAPLAAPQRAGRGGRPARGAGVPPARPRRARPGRRRAGPGASPGGGGAGAGRREAGAARGGLGGAGRGPAGARAAAARRGARGRALGLHRPRRADADRLRGRPRGVRGAGLHGQGGLPHAAGGSIGSGRRSATPR
jgi:hypothetical protein